MTPLRVGVLCSHRAPGLLYLLQQDAHHGRLYDLVCCATSEGSFAEQRAVMDFGIPVITHPIREFCRARGCGLSDRGARVAYDHGLVERLAPYRLDLIVLTSYLYVLTEPMLAAFRDRIVNIHHADLTLCDERGRPLLPGLRAVRDALMAGLGETRATVHLVTSLLDQGPPFLRSWPFPVSPLVADAVMNHAADVLKAYIYAHQEWMIRATWGPLAAAAIELIATRCLDLTALAKASPEDLDLPWDLDEDGRICGAGALYVKSGFRWTAEVLP